MFPQRFLSLFSLLLLLTACQSADLSPRSAVDLQLQSAAFTDNAEIPQQYTCDGADISPPLTWNPGPDETQSYVLIVDDPDAPWGTWVHWVVYNLPEFSDTLAEGAKVTAAKEGTNDFKQLAYGGPCPPKGEHRYVFKLYALDTMLQIPPKATKKDVEQAMQGHILATGELMGRYTRSRPE